MQFLTFSAIPIYAGRTIEFIPELEINLSQTGYDLLNLLILSSLEAKVIRKKTTDKLSKLFSRLFQSPSTSQKQRTKPCC